MSSKGGRKRLQPQSLKRVERVDITTEDFFCYSSNENRSTHEELAVSQLIDNLCAADSLHSQIRAIQSFKGTVRALLANPERQCFNEISASLQLLLQLYLLPKFQSLRNAMEWAIESMSAAKCCTSNEIASAASEVCLRIWKLAVEDTTATAVVASSSVGGGSALLHAAVEKIMDWSLTFSLLSNLEKEFHWLQVDSHAYVELMTKIMGANQILPNTAEYQHVLESSYSQHLFLYLSWLHKLSSACIGSMTDCAPPAAAAAASSSNNNNNNITASASEVHRIAECTGEYLRAITAALRRFYTLSEPVDFLPAIFNHANQLSCCNSILDVCFKVMRSKLVGRDVITSCAMCVSCILRLQHEINTCRGELNNTMCSSSSSSLSHQLMGLTGLILRAQVSAAKDETGNNNKPLLSANTEEFSSSLSFWCLHWGIPLNLVQSFDNGEFSAVVCCALLRCCVTVMDDSTLLQSTFEETKTNGAADTNTAVSLSEKKTLEVIASGNISTFSDHPPTPTANRNTTMLFGSMLETLIRMCQNSVVDEQLYALQSLDAWISRVLPLFDGLTCSTLPAAGTAAPLSDVMTNAPLAGSSVILPTEALCSQCVRISELLLTLWMHPAKLLHNIVGAIYNRVLDLVQAANQQQNKSAQKVWEPFLRAALRLPVWHRVRYQTFQQLLPRVGHALFLELEENIVHNLVQVVAERRQISSAACSFLMALLRSLIAARINTTMSDGVSGDNDTSASASDEQAAREAVRPMWVGAVASALCSRTITERINSTDYLVPEMLKLDPQCAIYVISVIRQEGIRESGGNGALTMEKLSGMIAVCLQARLLGLPGKDVDYTKPYGHPPFSSTYSSSSAAVAVAGSATAAMISACNTEEGSITAAELFSACVSSDSTLRLQALNTLSASLRTSEPIEANDWLLLTRTLQFSLKSHEHDHRSKVMRVVKNLMVRVRESHRVGLRDLPKLSKQLKELLVDPQKKAEENNSATASSSTGAGTESSSRRRKNAAAAAAAMAAAASAGLVGDAAEAVLQDPLKALEVQISHMQLVMERNKLICVWLRDILLDHLYPGATFDCEMMALELLRDILDTMVATRNPEAVGTAAATASSANSTDPSLISTFYNKRVTLALVNLLSSSWDRSRRLAADLLLSIPSPTPGFDTPELAQSLLSKAMALSSSARIQESDAGALLLRNVCILYVWQLGWKLNLSSTAVSAASASVSTSASALQKPGSTAVPLSLTDGIIQCTSFFYSVCDELDSRLGHMQVNLESFSAQQQQICVANNTVVVSSDVVDAVVDSGAMEISSGGTSMAAVPAGGPQLCHGLLQGLRLTLLELLSAKMLCLAPPPVASSFMSKSDDGSSSNSTACTTQHDTDGNDTKRYRIENTILSQEEQPTASQNLWQPCTWRLFSTAIRALHVAMIVVAESSSDSFFAPIPTIDASLPGSVFNNKNRGESNKSNNGGSNGKETTDTFVCKGPINSSSFVQSVAIDNNNNSNSSTVIFNDNDKGSGSDDSKKKRQHMAASYVNTNSSMGSSRIQLVGNTSNNNSSADDCSGEISYSVGSGKMMSGVGGEEGGDDENSGAYGVENEVQRAVVGAWLLVKEACALIACLVEISPPPKSSNSNNNSNSDASVNERKSNADGAGSRPSGKTGKKGVGSSSIAAAITAVGSVSRGVCELLKVEDINLAGDTILDALGRLKHMGAISTAHQALQSITAALLKHGDRSVTLCRLPAQWLQHLLNRLNGERQVFILRRSAGFAYSFISLLRAEPSTCKPTLLPTALQCLLDTIEDGLAEEHLSRQKQKQLKPGTARDGSATVASSTKGPQPQAHLRNGSSSSSSGNSSSGRWKLAVHSFNTIRLILSDALLGPEINNFVSRAVELAVWGFRSQHWAVRNSAMMAFASAVQRTVDNDKSSSGGLSVTAVSAADFFRRFQPLFPFILEELQSTTSTTTTISSDTLNADADLSSTVAKSEVVVANEQLEAQHPTLFPMLLLLSKMRAAMTETEEKGGEEDDSEDQEASGTSAIAADDEEAGNTKLPSKTKGGSATTINTALECDLSLLVSPISAHRSSHIHQIRAVAARALVAVLPLQNFPITIAILLKEMQVLLSSSSSSSSSSSCDVGLQNICMNELHGILLQISELTTGTLKYAEKSTISGGRNNAATATASSSAAAGGNNPVAALLVSFVHSEELGQLLAGVVDACRTIRCAPIHSALLKTVLTFNALAMLNESLNFSCSSQQSTADECRRLLAVQCCNALQGVVSTVSRSEGDSIIVVPHFTPENAITLKPQPKDPLMWKEAVSELVCAALAADISLGCAGKEANSNSLQTCTGLHHVHVRASKNVKSASSGRRRVSLTLEGLHFLMRHPLISDIREGAVLGCLRHLECSSSPSAAAAAADACALYDMRTVDCLLSAAELELEPPVLQPTVKLLSRVVRFLSASAPQQLLQVEERVHHLCLCLAFPSKQFAAVRPLPARAAAAAAAEIRTDVGGDSNFPPSFHRTAASGLRVLAPTAAANYSVEIVGTLVSAHVKPLLSNAVQQRKGATAEREGTLFLPASAVRCVETLLHMASLASLESRSIRCRLAAARALRGSCLLQPAFSSLQLSSANSSSSSSSSSSSAQYSLRSWLYALTLLQDDDEDVREEANALCSNIEERSGASSNSLIVDDFIPVLQSSESFTLKTLSARIATVLSASIRAEKAATAIVTAAAVATAGVDEAKKSFFSVTLVLERWQRTLGASCNWAQYLATNSTGSSTQKIFAPEPENMFIEVVKSGQVLAAALCRGLLMLVQGATAAGCGDGDSSSSTSDVVNMLWEHAMRHASLAAQKLSEIYPTSTAGNNASDKSWVTYEAEPFQFLYGSLNLLKSMLECQNGEENEKEEAEEKVSMMRVLLIKVLAPQTKQQYAVLQDKLRAVLAATNGGTVSSSDCHPWIAAQIQCICDSSLQ